MRIFIALAPLLLATLSSAAPFNGAAVSNDARALTIATGDGQTIQAPRLGDQVEFERARVSKDGRFVGWLAVYPNCCTSYPVPLKLVVMDQENRLRTFVGVELAIFEWCFLPDSTAVAYKQGVLHGSDALHFELRKIDNERLLATYEYPNEEGENKRARKQAPPWVRCVPE